jgi:hypothetical protein
LMSSDIDYLNFADGDTIFSLELLPLPSDEIDLPPLSSDETPQKDLKRARLESR